jgi:hypothetical protein
MNGALLVWYKAYWYVLSVLVFKAWLSFRNISGLLEETQKYVNENKKKESQGTIRTNSRVFTI